MGFVLGTGIVEVSEEWLQPFWGFVVNTLIGPGCERQVGQDGDSFVPRYLSSVLA